MYGASPRNEPPGYWRRLFLVVFLVLAGFFVYNSVHVVMRLKPDPPPSVVGAKLSSNGAEYRSQKRMARACWDYAIEYVQKNYPFGSTLPEKPPPGADKRTGKPSAISALCWPRLRDAWTRQESWEKLYEWDTGWVTNARGSFQRTLHRILDFLNVTD